MQSFFFPESSPGDLAIGHGFEARSFKHRRNKFDFHTFLGVKQCEQQRNKFDETGQIVVPRALNHTKKSC